MKIFNVQFVCDFKMMYIYFQSEEDLDAVGISQKKLIKEKDVESLDIKHGDKINEVDDELPHGKANPLLRQDILIILDYIEKVF